MSEYGYLSNSDLLRIYAGQRFVTKRSRGDRIDDMKDRYRRTDKEDCLDRCCDHPCCIIYPD